MSTEEQHARLGRLLEEKSIKKREASLLLDKLNQAKSLMEEAAKSLDPNNPLFRMVEGRLEELVRFGGTDEVLKTAMDYKTTMEPELCTAEGVGPEAN